MSIGSMQFRSVGSISTTTIHSYLDIFVLVNALHAKQMTLNFPGVTGEVLEKLKNSYSVLKKAVPLGDFPLSPVLKKTVATYFYLYGACLSSNSDPSYKMPILVALGLLLEQQESTLKGTQLFKNILQSSNSLEEVIPLLKNGKSLEACQLQLLQDALNRMSKEVFIEKVMSLDEESAFETLLALRWFLFDLRPLDFVTAAQLAEELMNKATMKIPEHKWLFVFINNHMKSLACFQGETKGTLQELKSLKKILTFLEDNPDTLLCNEQKAFVYQQIVKVLSQFDKYRTRSGALTNELEGYGRTTLERLQISYQEILNALACTNSVDGFNPNFRNKLLREAILLALDLKRADPNFSLNFDEIGKWIRHLTQVVDGVNYQNVPHPRCTAEDAYFHVSCCKTIAEYAIACGNYVEAEERLCLGILISNRNQSDSFLWIKGELESLQASLNRPYVWMRRKIVPIVFDLAKNLIIQVALLAQTRLILFFIKLPKAKVESISMLEKGFVLISVMGVFISQWMDHLGLHVEKPYLRHSGILHALQEKEGKLVALAALIALAIPASFTTKAFIDTLRHPWMK